MARLAGKVAVITGATGGIGAAASRLFAAEGAALMLVDLDAARLEALAGETGAAWHACDVSDTEANEAVAAAAAERFGGIDIGLLNAGIEGALAPIGDYTVEMFDRVMAVNARGVWLGLKALMPHLERRGGGSLVLTSSTAGIRAVPDMSAYTASKHAVIGLMRAAAIEGSASNIRVNTVNPSPIDTRMIQSLEEMHGVQRAGANQPLAGATPLRRYGEPEEVARLMLFLASEESSFCTGGVYMVDGGVSAGRL